MILFRASLLALTVMFLSGCIGENMDGCVPNNNLILEFRYYGDGQTDILPENIHKVNVFIFDSENNLALQQSIDQTSLNAFKGTKLSLLPGTYRIVCWGNAFDKAIFEGVSSGSSFTDASVSNRTNNTVFEVENGDPLYYGPAKTSGNQTPVLSVTVPLVGTTSETVVFRCAHIKVEVYVKGFDDQSAQRQLLPPVIALTNIPSHYNFEMYPFGPMVNFRNISSYLTIDGTQIAAYDFYTPLFDADTPMQLQVSKQSDGSIVTTVDLANFIAENNITISEQGLTIIPILVEYKRTFVEVTLPGWIHNPVVPEL